MQVKLNLPAYKALNFKGGMAAVLELPLHTREQSTNFRPLENDIFTRSTSATALCANAFCEECQEDVEPARYHISDIDRLKIAGLSLLVDMKYHTGTKDALALHNEYLDVVNEYLDPEDPEDSDQKRVLRHEWRNLVASGVRLGLEIRPQCGKEPTRDERMDLARKTVNTTNHLLDVYQILTAESPNLTIEDTFNIALKIAKENAGGREINVENKHFLKQMNKGDNPFRSYTIFSNLLGNAIKYSPDNSQIDVLFEKKIELDKKNPDMAEIEYSFTVADEGIGIKPEDKERVLTEGARGSNVGNISGTGQGLYDVLCAAGKGNLEIISPLYPDAENKGTAIKVIMKKERADLALKNDTNNKVGAA